MELTGVAQLAELRAKMVRVGERIEATLRMRLTTPSPYVLDLILLLALSLVTLTWFRGAQLIWGDDSNLPLTASTAISSYSFLWNPSVSAIDPQKFAYVVPMGLILRFLGSIGLYSPIVFERVEIFVLMFFSGFSVYYLAGVVLEGRRYRRLGQLTAAIFHMFNFYAMITIWTSLAGIAFQYSFFPLVIALIIRGLGRGRGIRYAAVVSIVWTILLGPAYVTFPIVLTDWLVIALVGFYWIVVTHDGKSFKKTLVFLGSVFLFWLALNMSWIFVDFVSLGSLALRASGSAAFYSGQSVLPLQALSLSGYWGFFVGVGSSLYYPYSPMYSTIPFVILPLMIPLLVGLSLLLNRKSGLTLFFASLAIVFIIFATGPNSAFSTLNRWLFSNPLLSDAFRSPYQRFMGYGALGFAIVLGALASYSRPPEGSGKKGTRFRILLVATMLVLLSGALVWPMWTGDLYKTQGVFASRNIDIPQSYNDLSAWLSRQSGNFATLPLPYPTSSASLPLLWENGTQGYNGLYPFLLLSDNEFLIGNSLGAYAAHSILNGTINSSAFLDYFNIKYVMVHTDANWGLINGNPSYLGANISQINQSLSKIDGLTYVQSFGDIDVYLNTRWTQSTVYSLNTTSTTLETNELFVENHTLVPMNVQAVNPTLYSASIGSSGTVPIILTQAFDSGWQISLISSEGSVGNHFAAGGIMNGWVVSCQSPCVVEITFAPQTELLYLQLLSGSFFVILVGLIGITWLRGRRHGQVK